MSLGTPADRSTTAGRLSLDTESWGHTSRRGSPLVVVSKLFVKMKFLFFKTVLLEDEKGEKNLTSWLATNEWIATHCFWATAYWIVIDNGANGL